MWRRAWVRACGDAHFWNGGRIMQDEGRGAGLLIQGTRAWNGYEASARVTPRSKFRQGGIAVCVQGCERWVALTLAEGGKARLVKALDGETILAEADFSWEPDQTFDLSLTTVGAKYVGKINGAVVLEATDTDRPLESGAAALIAEAGRLDFEPLSVKPA
jgi:hypothetical protein